MYRYLKNPRLQLFFISPNVCAAWLAMMIVLLFGFACVCWQKKTKSRWIACCLFAVILGLSGLLAMTYSRGGILSALIAMTAFSALTRSKIAMGWVVAFLLGVFLLLPSGAARMRSMTQIHDGSILHRFWLWRGACGLTAMRPCRGWSPHACGKLYAQWYQPESVREHYRTMISDVLTISVRHGFRILFPLLLVCFAILWIAGRNAYSSRSAILAGLLCSCLSYLVGSCFSTLYEQPEVFPWFLCILIVTFCFTAGNCLIKKFAFRPLLDCCIPFATALLICGAIWFVGCWTNLSMSYRHFEYRLMHQGEEKNLVLTAFPCQKPKALAIFFLPADAFGGDKNIYGLPSFREWLKDGYAIVSVALESGRQGLEASKVALNMAVETADGLPMLVVGVGIVGNFALLNSDAKARALGLRGFIGIKASIDWPLEDLSPLAHVAEIEVPGYIMDDDNDKMDEFLQAAKAENKSVQGLLFPETSTTMTSEEEAAQVNQLAMELAAQLLLKEPRR